MLNCHFCILVFKVKLKIYKVIAEGSSLPREDLEADCYKLNSLYGI